MNKYLEKIASTRWGTELLKKTISKGKTNVFDLVTSSRGKKAIEKGLTKGKSLQDTSILKGVMRSKTINDKPSIQVSPFTKTPEEFFNNRKIQRQEPFTKKTEKGKESVLKRFKENLIKEPHGYGSTMPPFNTGYRAGYGKSPNFNEFLGREKSIKNRNTTPGPLHKMNNPEYNNKIITYLKSISES